MYEKIINSFNSRNMDIFYLFMTLIVWFWRACMVAEAAWLSRRVTSDNGESFVCWGILIERDRKYTGWVVGFSLCTHSTSLMFSIPISLFFIAMGLLSLAQN